MWKALRRKDFLNSIKICENLFKFAVHLQKLILPRYK